MEANTGKPSVRAIQPRATTGKRRHVLLAEDDDEMRQLTAQVLRKAGCDVTECVDGSDLLIHLDSYLGRVSPGRAVPPIPHRC